MCHAFIQIHTTFPPLIEVSSHFYANFILTLQYHFHTVPVVSFSIEQRQ